ncbi:MAG TPA: ABC transporter permease [Bacilli bacterium]|jgi:oligopeptide transport system permease protein|nr:ABC transporter permease [Bacilli bacterium]HPY38766.1 ABC transporter permease [Bacilli bacterium]HQC33010.1 ABC transporter permease [Bacilli bacterium]
MANNSVKNIDSVIYHNVEDLFTVIGASEESIEKLSTAPYSYWRETFKQLIKKPLAILSVIVILLIVFFTIFGPMMKSYRVVSNSEGLADIFTPNQSWSADHWFGTGGNKMNFYKGLDLWTVVWVGARLSLILGTVVALIDTFLGILIGSLWGYFRRLDPIMIEIRNFVNNVPSLLLYFLLMAFLTPNFWTIVFLLTMFGWIGLAGFIRNQIIIIRNRDYNIASVTLGSSPKAMITHNLLPYLISVIVTVVSTAIPAAVSSEVGLAFFGLSFSPAAGDVTLGQVLTDATRDEWMTYPYLLIAPMIVLVPLTVTFFYIGLALADATDPKNHR